MGEGSIIRPVQLFYGCVIFHWPRSPSNPLCINQVFRVADKGRHRMLETQESLSAYVIEVRMGRNVDRPIFPDMLFPSFLLVIFKSSLVFVFKTPEMLMQIHGFLSGSICSSSAN